MAAHALRVLGARNIKGVDVVAVDTFGLTVTDKYDQVWTVWTWREQRKGKAEWMGLRFEPGLPAFPTKP